MGAHGGSPKKRAGCPSHVGDPRLGPPAEPARGTPTPHPPGSAMELTTALMWRWEAGFVNK
jgi:hypothetical protein